jgi:hypothetical protein
VNKPRLLKTIIEKPNQMLILTHVGVHFQSESAGHAGEQRAPKRSIPRVSPWKSVFFAVFACRTYHCSLMPRQSGPTGGERMSKSMDKKKETKKAPQKSAKEKKQAKLEKKKTKE